MGTDDLSARQFGVQPFRVRLVTQVIHAVLDPLQSFHDASHHDVTAQPDESEAERQSRARAGDQDDAA